MKTTPNKRTTTTETEELRITFNQLGLDAFLDEMVSVLVDYEDPISKSTMWTGLLSGTNKDYIF